MPAHARRATSTARAATRERDAGGATAGAARGGGRDPTLEYQDERSRADTLRQLQRLVDGRPQVQRQAELKAMVNDNEVFFGGTVAYRPLRHDAHTRLYAPYFERNGAQAGVAPTVASRSMRMTRIAALSWSFSAR
jgi:hypothetical protein